MMLKWATAGMIALTAFPAGAHDYWLQPQQFFLSNGQSTGVQLFVGDHFVRQTERPFQAKMTPDLRLVSQHETTNLKTTATDGKRPVATIAPKRPGSYLVVMERDWSHIEIEAEKFNKYLEHEGLSTILKLRRSAGESKIAGRERYRRYLKALVQVGDELDETYKRKIGHRLEILPLTNPSECDKGDRVAVSVLFDGKPLRGAMVAVYNRQSNDTKTQASRTDDNGQVRFVLDGSGLWLVRLVHMQRCKNVDECDWESFWAAYSFESK